MVKPRLHVFGHIHDGHGRIRRRGTTFVNASVCDEDYLPLNPAVVVRLKASEQPGRGPCEGQTT
jgi:Icc-related predicted phosphoesterase